MSSKRKAVVRGAQAKGGAEPGSWRTPLLAIALSFLGFGALVAAVVGWDHLKLQRARADGIGGAALFLGGARPELVVLEHLKRSTTRARYADHRLSAYDPATGARRWRRDLDHSERGDPSLELWGFQGGLWLWGATYPIEQRLPNGELRASHDDLAKRVPSIALPWYNWGLDTDAMLVVEGDDKRQWRLEPERLEGSPRGEGAPIFRDKGAFIFETRDVWARRPRGEEDATLLFVAAEKLRHSDPPRYELTTSRGIDPFQHPMDPRPVPLRLETGGSSPRFLCEGSTSRVLTLSEPESALVTFRPSDGARGFARIGLRGELVWTRAVPMAESVELRFFRHERAVLIVGPGRLVRLDVQTGAVELDVPLE